MLSLGTALPHFDLAAVSGLPLIGVDETKGLERICSDRLPQKPLLLMVLCAHCPFVKHIEIGLTRLDKDYGDRIHILAIASNSVITHPQDGPEELANQIAKNGWRFPYLLDLDQTLAKSLQAACTPDFYLFSGLEQEQKYLRYRGQLDSSRPGNNIAVTGMDLRAALDAVLLGQSIEKEQKPSIGCNIKWHPGEEPAWFDGGHS